MQQRIPQPTGSYQAGSTDTFTFHHPPLATPTTCTLSLQPASKDVSSAWAASKVAVQQLASDGSELDHAVFYFDGPLHTDVAHGGGWLHATAQRSAHGSDVEFTYVVELFSTMATSACFQLLTIQCDLPHLSMPLQCLYRTTCSCESAWRAIHAD